MGDQIKDVGNKLEISSTILGPWCAKLYRHAWFIGWVEVVGETNGNSLAGDSMDDKISSVKVRDGCTFKGYDGYELDWTPY